MDAKAIRQSNGSVESSQSSPKGQPRRPDETNGSSDGPQFNRFGQHEPAVVRIRNIITQYVGESRGFGVDEIVKELVQNADDASATEVHFILDKRTLACDSVWDEWAPLQGPAFCIYNNNSFTKDDIDAIQKLGVGSKGSNPDKTGQFGIGFNVVYQLTDCPVLLSGNKDVCMFDPHLCYVPGANDERPGGHVDLQSDPEFKETWGDFMEGFLPQYFNIEDGTLFRLPLRQKENASSICKLGYGDKELDQMQHHLQSIDFRMFLHNAVLFTKNIEKIGVSCINKNGNLENLCSVVRRINEKEKNELKCAFRQVSKEMRSFIEGKITVDKISKFSVFYDLVIEDEYSSHKWFASQSFGFQKQLKDSEIEFLKGYFKEGSKRFLPVGGIANRRDNTSTFKGVVYSFLQLPIVTGLPVHINGHFAIHSSRRTIWSSTAFGQWNTILRDNVLVPAYCHFIKDLTKVVTHSNMKLLVSVLPEASKTKDVFFGELVDAIYQSFVQDKWPIIPITEADDQITYSHISDVYFVSQKRNTEIENTLTKLGVSVCRYQDVSWMIQRSGIKNIRVISPEVVMVSLKLMADKLGLPAKVENTSFESSARIAMIIEYCLGENTSSNQLSHLAGVPLCLTSDGVLRVFDVNNPVFVTVGFSVLLPNNPDLILHKDLCHLFTISPNPKERLPVKNLNTSDIAMLLQEDISRMKTIKWCKLFWAFLKREISTGLWQASELLRPFLNLPLLPSSRGGFVNLSKGKALLDIANVNSNIQMIIEKLELPTVSLKALGSANVTEREISQFLHSFVLDAVLPEDFLKSVSENEMKNPKLSSEECEQLLQYINVNVEVLQNVTYREALSKLPLFETIESEYRALPLDKMAVILDNCIPTRGISTWMEQSDCILLKEKTAYTQLYESLGLARKNAVDVYFRDVLPNFDRFDEELRMAHLQSIRDNIIPLLPTFGTPELESDFWTQLTDLPFISFEGKLYKAGHFYDSQSKVIERLGTHQQLPDIFAEQEWTSMLTRAGLKISLTSDEILKCATILSESSGLTDDREALLQTAKNSDLSDEEWRELSKIRFIPQMPIEVETDLLNICLPAIPVDELVSLNGSVLYESMKDRQLYRSSILGWSCVPSLPKWVDIPADKFELLGIHDKPTVEEVCRHCVKLCEAMTEYLPDKAFNAFKKIIHYIFDYLKPACKCNKKGCSDCTGLRALSNSACIPIKGGTVRLKPCQVVLRFPTDIDTDFLQPYVYPRPQDLGKHDELLLRIGCFRKPFPDTYAEVLHRIRQEIGNAPLQANQKLTASMAVYGMFTSLQDGSATVTTRPLYLPSEKAIMILGQELVANDNDIIAKAVRDRNFDYLCMLTSCNLTKSPSDYLSYLPLEIRPKCLSQIFSQEIRIDAKCSYGLDCDFIRTFRQRIRSKKFIDAIWLIARVTERQRLEFKSELDRLKILDFECCDAMTTFLTENGRMVDCTDKEECVHLSNTTSTCKLVVTHADDYPGTQEQVGKVASSVKSVICFNKEFFIDSGVLVRLILCKTDDDIADVLIEEGFSLKEDDMSAPKPGSDVPELDQTLFSYNPDVRFDAKEYVGYLKPSAGGGEPQLVFARVIRETVSKTSETDDGPDMFREYDIDAGLGYPITVQSLDLCREVKRQSLQENKQLVAAHVTGPVLSSKTDTSATEEAKRVVTKLIEEVFADPNRVDERDKLKKRLCLKWHPDKLGNTDTAKQVFQHLTMEFERLSKKYIVIADETEDTEEQMYDWEEDNMALEEAPEKTPEELAAEEEEKLAALQKVEEERKANAEKWVKQCLKDLACAQLLQENGGFEWASNLCHEVVRKILVATIVCHMRLTSDLEKCTKLSNLVAAISKLENLPGQLVKDVNELNQLKVDAFLSREPGLHGGLVIPADVYSEKMADRSVEVTEIIVDYMLRFLGFHDKG